MFECHTNWSGTLPNNGLVKCQIDSRLIGRLPATKALCSYAIMPLCRHRNQTAAVHHRYFRAIERAVTLAFAHKKNHLPQHVIDINQQRGADFGAMLFYFYSYPLLDLQYCIAHFDSLTTICKKAASIFLNTSPAIESMGEKEREGDKKTYKHQPVAEIECCWLEGSTYVYEPKNMQQLFLWLPLNLRHCRCRFCWRVSLFYAK